ncbi:magnesium transporter [Xanthobacteraceae bacterium A53D]
MRDASEVASADVLDLPVRGEEGEIFAPFLEQIRDGIAAGDAETVTAALHGLHEADVGDLMEALQPDERPRLVELQGDAFDFTALTELDETDRVQLLHQLPPQVVAAGIRTLDSDDAVYILEDLDEDDKAAILALIPAPERVALERSLDYPEESAGRRMQTEFIAVPPFWTVGRAIDYMRETENLPETFYEIFVVDPAYHLMGALPLDRLLRTKRSVLVTAVKTERSHVVKASEDQEEVARTFERYNLVSAPVVDDGGRLVGVITVDDIVDVIQEEADEDLRAMAGVGSDEELSDSVAYTARGRLPWLLVNLLTAAFAASIIDLFSDSIQKMVALAVLMPIVATIGGSAGNQTMTVAVRALATKDLGSHNARRIVTREVLVGLCNGCVLALMLGTAAALWFSNWQLGGVIAAALVINMLVAGLFGILIPLLIHRFKLDPAVASGVFVTTVTDTVGFFAFLGLASLWFRG